MINGFRYRPLVLFCIAISLGVAIKLFPLNAIGLGLLWFFRSDKKLLTLAVFGLAFGLLFGPRVLSKTNLKHAYFDGQLDIVTMPRNTAEGYTFIGQSGTERLQVITRARFDISLGDRLQANGNLVPLTEYSERYYLDRGVSRQLKLKVTPQVVDHGALLWRWALRIRSSFERFTHRSLPLREAGLLDAICFSDRAEIPPDLAEPLLYSGVYHLIGSTGAKVFILAGLLGLVGKLLPIPKIHRTILISFLVLLYVAACGLTPSAFRAFLMYELLVFAPFFRREYDLYTGLAVVFLGSFYIDPSCLLEPGFQLTMLCLVGLGTFAPKFHRYRERLTARDICMNSARFAITAWAFSVPILAYHFLFVSLSTPLATLLLIIPFSLLLYSSLLAWIMPIFALLVRPMLWFIEITAKMFGEPLFFVPVTPFSAYWLVLIYGLALSLRRHDVQRA